MTRNIEEDYKQAYIAEHASYATAGRAKEAAAVAKILKDHYGHDTKPVKERADENAPERAVEEAPQKRGRPKLPRDADGNIVH